MDYKIEIKYNTTMPDGTYLKRLDTKKINKLGWKPKITLEDGIRKTLNYYVNNNLFQ